MTILFTDIPSEYNGRSAATWVLCIDGTSKNTLLFAEGKSRVITNGKVLIDLFYRRGEFGSGGWTAKDKGEYIIKLQIFVMPDGDFWGGESDLINITKKNTTISFKSLKKYDWY